MAFAIKLQVRCLSFPFALRRLLRATEPASLPPSLNLPLSTVGRWEATFRSHCNLTRLPCWHCRTLLQCIVNLTWKIRKSPLAFALCLSCCPSVRGFAPLGDGARCPVSDSHFRVNHCVSVSCLAAFYRWAMGRFQLRCNARLPVSLGNVACFASSPLAPHPFLPLGDGFPAIPMPA